MKLPAFLRLSVLLMLLCLGSGGVACADELGVRIRFGLKDREPTVWDGRVSVDSGRVVLLSGWRFEQTDRVEGEASWKASTRAAATLGRTNNPQKAQKAKKKGAGTPPADNGVLLTLSGVKPDSVIAVKTRQGDFEFRPSELKFGNYIERLSGSVEIERIAATVPITSDARTDDDYPSAAAGPEGTIYIAYTSYTPGIDRQERSRGWEAAPPDLSFLAAPPGGDQLFLRSVRQGAAGDPIAVTPPGQDIYKSAVAVAGDGTVWVFWSHNRNYKPFPDNPQANFDIWARSWKEGQLGDPLRLSEAEGNDVWPVAAADGAGRIWVVWQGAREGVFRILARRQTEQGWSPEMVISTQQGNCWAPAIAVAARPEDRLAIAWDTYDKGDYDIWVRECDSQGECGEARPVANSEDYEARPALTYDLQGALWISWEQSGPTWGKDWGALVQRKGIGLYRDRQIGLAVWKGGKWLETPELVVQALPGAQPRRRVANQRVPAIEPQGETRAAGQEAEARRNLPHNNIARIICDSGGHIWLLARARQNDFRSQVGSVWLTHAAYYDGDRWVGPILIPHSDNLLYNSPAVVAPPDGGVVLAHSSDHRQDRHLVRRGANALGILDLYVSRLGVGEKAPSASLVEAKVLPQAEAGPSPATQKERDEIARIRDFRATLEGTELRIVRGEFHRHTEISGDGGNDGPLEDMWRYAIDVAAMDWLGCGDHDNGGHREYPWWLTQKTTDAFHLPGNFEPPFTYERSVRYPEGHRNVVFTRRGIRTLPRLPITNRDNVIHAPDTQLLYKYLHLFDGVCAVHTSATSMGTDWRDNDPEVEPMVEIYQGARQNYERPGAPRSPTADDAIGGWEPKGFVNLALLKGYKFSFQSSSDHGSTHISYALVYAQENSREAIFEGMKRRHTYAATDNIIADFRCRTGEREYMMGDDFETATPPTLQVKLVGTAPFARITLIKDDVEIPLAADTPAEFEVQWSDMRPRPGQTSYYYVRGEQQDGELVWVSPMWITYKPKP